MKKGILWLMLSWLIVAAFVLTSCGPAVPGEQEEEEEEEEEIIPTLSIGETFQSPEAIVTVSEVIVGDSYDHYDTYSKSTVTKEASPGTFFLIFTAEIENVGLGDEETPWNVGREQFRIFDSEGSEYRHFPYYAEDRLPLKHGVIYRGDKIKGTVLFNIPEGASGLKIAFSLTTFPLKKVVEWEIE